jgi:hypothetical protein
MFLKAQNNYINYIQIMTYILKGNSPRKITIHFSKAEPSYFLIFKEQEIIYNKMGNS